MLEPHADVKPVEDALGSCRELTRITDVLAAVGQHGDRNVRADPDGGKEHLLPQPLVRVVAGRVGVGMRTLSSPRTDDLRSDSRDRTRAVRLRSSPQIARVDLKTYRAGRRRRSDPYPWPRGQGQ